jgi:hypothetical protein
MVYSTCSLEPEENEAVVACVPKEQVRETMQRLPGRDPGDGFYACVIGGTDERFMSSEQRGAGEDAYPTKTALH